MQRNLERGRKIVLWGLLTVALGCEEISAPSYTPAPNVATSERQSLYVEVRDGTRLALDVHLPANLEHRQRVPAVLRITRYWRAIELTDGGSRTDPYLDAIIEHGHAYVAVDVRGSGASFGVSSMPWSKEEVLDYRDVLDWLVDQPWSNGRVGALGDSYEGNTAALLSALEHPAVRAVVPRFFDLDPYLSPASPGGLFNEDFIRSWSDMTDGLDSVDLCKAARAASDVECKLLRAAVRGPLRVDADHDGKLLEKAVAEHRDNADVYDAVDQITFRDDEYGASGSSLSDVAPFAYADAIGHVGVPWFTWGSWYDSATANSALSAFATFGNPQQVIIGAWSHGAHYDADPYHAADEPIAITPEDQLEQALDFLDDHLHHDAAPAERSIRYYTAGEGKWRTVTSWPPPGTQNQVWYLDRDATLSSEPSASPDRDSYAVDFSATTGASNRWATQKDGSDVVYPNRASESAKLLNYTSEPLAKALHVVGHPVIALYLAANQADAAVFAYLEDVDPEGRVTYLTEGELRLLHRKQADAPYVGFGAQHSFLRADGAEVTPNQPELVELTLQPVAALIAKGHRLRISIAGHDAGTFRRYPATGPAELTIERSSEQPSRLSLPFLP
jgi:uncharacterized protein